VNKIYNPPSVTPGPGYSHGVEIAPGARILYTAGQLGIGPDGKFLPDFRGQAEQAWRNIETILQAAGMGMADLVKVNHYLVRKEDFPVYREVRAKMLGPHAPASTLVFISSLARDGALVEVEAVAAK